MQEAASQKMPQGSLDRIVGAVQQAQKDFEEKIWPLFCKAVDDKLDAIKARVEEIAGAQQEIKRDINGWHEAQAERKGAWAVLRAQGMILLRILQFAIPAGGVGGAMFWLLALLTGHV